MLPVRIASCDDVAWGAAAIPVDSVADVIRIVDESATAVFDAKVFILPLTLHGFPLNQL